MLIVAEDKLKLANEENIDIRTNLQDRIQELTKLNTDLENKYINKVKISI